MGLFGPKISKEQKEYQKALKAAIHKPNKKAVSALQDATKAYPAGWQGHWLSGLFYDIGFDKNPIDSKKAKECFLMAESAAKGTEAEAWLNTFFTWYRRDAGNLNKTLTEQQEKIYRMGVAMCQTYQEKNAILSKIYGSSDDGFEMRHILWFVNDDNNIAYPFLDFLTIPTFDENEQFKSTVSFYKAANKADDTYLVCLKNRSDPKWEQMHDMYLYLWAHGCINGSNLLTAQVAAQIGKGENELGIKYYLYAANIGNQPAIHELIRLAHASESNYNFMDRIYRKIYHFRNEDLNCFLLARMKDCIEKGDQEASRLFDRFYATRLS